MHPGPPRRPCRQRCAAAEQLQPGVGLGQANLRCNAARIALRNSFRTSAWHCRETSFWMPLSRGHGCAKCPDTTQRTLSLALGQGSVNQLGYKSQRFSIAARGGHPTLCTAIACVPGAKNSWARGERSAKLLVHRRGAIPAQPGWLPKSISKSISIRRFQDADYRYE